MTAYYNEIDPYAAQWLRNLIDAGHIARGDVDERSIIDVRPGELAGYTQCHFFAGIGGWSVALRLAGWPDNRSVWTGSCPCQPFSAAGKGEAADDERHLWPAWFPLIAQRRPPVVFGEQVEAAVGWGWLDAVFADLENEGYACGAAVLPACGIGAPHIRQRCWFMADAIGNDYRREAKSSDHRRNTEAIRSSDWTSGRGSSSLPLADAERRSSERWRHDLAGSEGDTQGETWERERIRADARPSSQPSELGDAMRPERRPETEGRADVKHGSDARWQEAPSGQRLVSEIGNLWRCDWLPCTDGKARPVESGTFPLAHGIPGRVGRLRAYGNAIVPQVAAEFIKAASD